EGMAVLSTGSGSDAIALARRGRPDLVILDLGLPDVPGEDVVQDLRTVSDVPVLMLTAKASERDRIRGLELGADDYMTKPFSPRELVLRARAILRRGRDTSSREDRSSFGNEILLDNNTVDLTPTEWSLLIALATTPGRVYSRFELINRTRGYEFEGYERTVDSHVKNLRRKIERNPASPTIIET